jgi:hypothetical protein
MPAGILVLLVAYGLVPRTDVDRPAEYTAPTVTIHAKPRDCSFSVRPLVQGSGSVRGFCTSELERGKGGHARPKPV